MRIYDYFKRWQLTKQGLSSGKKRKVFEPHPIVDSLEHSVWVRISIYLAFLIISAVLCIQSEIRSTPINAPLYFGSICVLMSLSAVVVFHVALKGICKCNSHSLLVFSSLLAQFWLIRVILNIAHSEQINPQFHLLFIPFLFAPMLLTILLGRSIGGFATVFASIIGALMCSHEHILSFLLLSLLSGSTCVILTHHVRKRIQLLKTGLCVGAIVTLASVMIGILNCTNFFDTTPILHIKNIASGMATAIGTAILTSMIISGLLPIFENLFNLTTDISWLELSDLNHKLLRRLQLEAPGTFHHSLIVAALSEAAAERIGANPIMCRVCSYFHDIGKLSKPQYFIENLSADNETPHKGLTPTMSALIIIAHVKDGIDLAVKHKLNPQIIRIIQEHHGDSLVAYFHNLAQKQEAEKLNQQDKKLLDSADLPTINEHNFKYPGPCPSSRESTIISLADTIESASRSLIKPTPAKIKDLIDTLVSKRFNENQLDDSILSLQELSIVKESFAVTLRSMMHNRIAYPAEKKNPSSQTSPSPSAP